MCQRVTRKILLNNSNDMFERRVITIKWTAHFWQKGSRVSRTQYAHGLAIGFRACEVAIEKLDLDFSKR